MRGNQKKAQLTIIIVSWNTRKLLSRCLQSIRKFGMRFNPEVWVVDNASSDNSARMVKDNFPWVKLLASQQNFGFAKANNLILKKNNCLEVDQIPGACFFTRHKTLQKFGFLNENYPIWFEDVDLCFRLKKAG